MAEHVSDQFGAPGLIKGVQSYSNSVDEKTLIEINDSLVKAEFTPRERRCGLIARKIGVVPLWRNDGSKMWTTMLQIDDNHVIKYYGPDEYTPAQTPRVKNIKKFGCLLVGAGSADPSLFTKEYCGLFKDSGVMPKRYLGRFLVTPNAKLLPGNILDFPFQALTSKPFLTVAFPFSGTPLGLSHFRVGDFVDVRGKT